jgi:hypothetical protein
MTRNSELNSPRSNSAAVRQFCRLHTTVTYIVRKNIRYHLVFTNWFLTKYPPACYISQSICPSAYRSTCRSIYQSIRRNFLLSIHQSYSLPCLSNWQIYFSIWNVITGPNSSRLENRILHNKIRNNKHSPWFDITP